MIRRPSEETLTTLVDSGTLRDNGDVASLQETLFDRPMEVFGRPAPQYNTVREYVIVLRNLTPGVCIFRSKQHFDDYRARKVEHPLLQTYLPIITGIFMRNAPFMVISHFVEGQRRDYCRVFFKVTGNDISHYTMEFSDGFVVVLFNNNSNKPCVDFMYKETKVRTLGVTTSTFGNGLIRCFVMPDSAEMLCDGQVENTRVDCTALANNAFGAQIERRHRGEIQRNLRQPPAIQMPFATYIDDNVRVGSKYVREGTIKMFACGNGESEVDEMTFACVLLVLREQENRKMKGHGKPKATYDQREGRDR